MIVFAGAHRSPAGGFREGEEGLQPPEGGESREEHPTAQGSDRPLLPFPVVPEEHGPERREGEAGPERGGGLGSGGHGEEHHHGHHGRR